jgi:hypothetical protein
LITIQRCPRGEAVIKGETKMAAFGKIASITGYRGETQPESVESSRCTEFALRISELPGAVFAAITLFYVVSEIARLIW